MVKDKTLFRDGYARKNNDNGARVTKCDVAGWIEPLSSFPKCVRELTSANKLLPVIYIYRIYYYSIVYITTIQYILLLYSIYY